MGNVKKKCIELFEKEIENNHIGQYSARADLERIRQQRKNATGEKLQQLSNGFNEVMGIYMELRKKETIFKEKVKFLQTYQDREPDIPSNSGLVGI